jgi:hypothetical protein
MEITNPLEDWRGVDIDQINNQLRMSVPDRVRIMVEAANVMMSMQSHALAARAKKSG